MPKNVYKLSQADAIHGRHPMPLEFVEQEAEKLHAGDRITWEVPAWDSHHPLMRDSKKRVRLTVTGQTKHLILAVDHGGKMRTITKVEWALEIWRSSWRKNQKRGTV